MILGECMTESSKPVSLSSASTTDHWRSCNHDTAALRKSRSWLMIKAVFMVSGLYITSALQEKHKRAVPADTRLTHTAICGMPSQLQAIGGEAIGIGLHESRWRSGMCHFCVIQRFCNRTEEGKQ